ncbi:MAG: hypothetical protein JWM68_4465 [Verrucomicrobiales bacterium]|nr:hypothetical protein [Verrucomicrobiales bacterium]
MKPRHQATNANRIASQDESAAAEKFQEDLMQSQEAESHHLGRIFRTNDVLDQELEYVSDGIDDSGNEYELYLGQISRSPIVKSMRTGKCYLLPWSDLINLAEGAGINE